MTARVLFLHHNFPAQFRFLAPALARSGHDVVFLSERNFVGAIPGVRQILVDSPKRPIASALAQQLACAERFRFAMQKLLDDGWKPDIVVSHSGWGCGLHVSWVFPKARLISYLEWWFQNDSAEYSFDQHNHWWNYSPASQFKLRQRNLSIALELCEADSIVSPTNWQRSQLPQSLQSRCCQIHEGVDVKYYLMNTAWRPKDRLRITYATRGMEPMRGFPEFIQSLSKLLESRSDIEVVIAGDDRVAYGGHLPAEGSFGKWAKKILSPWVKCGTVQFVGNLPKLAYARLLKSSHVHCYLTRPFVASWSLLDAMASGCCLVASDLEVVREMADVDATFWTDHRNDESLLTAMQLALDVSSDDRFKRGKAQQLQATTRWSREQSLEKWKDLLGI